jgi:Probable zinc-ribbon domain
MKSGKQRRLEIKERRLARAKAMVNVYYMDALVHKAPKGAVMADLSVLGSNNNTYGLLPVFYVDRPFACRKCATEEVWTAKQQKWWYEVALGDINTTAVHCRPCRMTERKRVEDARRASAEGLRKKREALLHKLGDKPID